MRRLIVVLRSIHDVLAAEKALKAGEVAVDLVPVPRRLSSNCGMALELSAEDRERALACLNHDAVVTVEELDR